MRITSKGQVTIPVEIREKAGLLPNTEVEWEIDGDVVRLRPAGTGTKSGRKTRGQLAVEALKNARTKSLGLTTDEIMALMRPR